MKKYETPVVEEIKLTSKEAIMANEGGTGDSDGGVTFSKVRD